MYDHPEDLFSPVPRDTSPFSASPVLAGPSRAAPLQDSRAGPQIEPVGAGWLIGKCFATGLAPLPEETTADAEHDEIVEYDFEDYRKRQTVNLVTPPVSPRVPRGGMLSQPSTPFVAFTMDPRAQLDARANPPRRHDAFDPVVGSPAMQRLSRSPAALFDAYPTPSTTSYRSPPAAAPPATPGKSRKSDDLIQYSSALSPTRQDDFSRTYGGQQDEGGAQEREKRVESRYVLVQNLPTETSRIELGKLIVSRFSSALKAIFCSLLRASGVIVLVFFDSRDGTRAVDILEWERGFGRRLVASCITRELFASIPDSASFLSNSEGNLTLSTRPLSFSTESNFPLSSLALKNHLESFGELKAFRFIEQDDGETCIGLGIAGGGGRFSLEFFDERDTERVWSAWNGLKIDGSEMMAVLGLEKTLVPLAEIESQDLESAPLDALDDASECQTRLSPRSESFVPAAAPLKTISNSYPRPNPSKSATLRSSTPPLKTPKSKPKSSAIAVSATPAPLSSLGKANQIDPVDLAQLSLAQATAFLTRTARQRSSSTPTEPVPRASPNKSKKQRNGDEKRYGIYREDKIPLGNILRLDWIEQGQEKRTTLMIKNVPNRIDADTLASLINEVVPNSFDFLYLRIDFSNNCNVGYGFVNFIDVESLYKWAKTKLGKRWNVCSSEKVYIASYAAIQGKDALITKFRSSSVMDAPPACRPRIFHSSGPLRGQAQTFPLPDDPKRKARSIANLQNVGLFPSQKPVFKVTRVRD